MPGRSIILRICRLSAFNPKQVVGGFRGPFCDPIEEVLKFLVGNLFVWGMTDSRKKLPLGVRLHGPPGPPPSVPRHEDPVLAGI